MPNTGKQTNIRPTKDQIEAGKDGGWKGFELEHGYGIFQDSPDDFEYVAKIDDMEVFEADDDAAKQAERDGMILLEISADEAGCIEEDDRFSPSVTRSNVIDTPHNRKVLEKVRSMMRG